MNFPTELSNPINPDVLDCIQRHRTIKIFGEIGHGPDRIEPWKKAVDRIYKRNNSMMVLINSSGGFIPTVWDLEKLIDEWRKEGKKFYTLGNYCSSAALEALMLGHPDGVFLRPTGRLIYHTTSPIRDKNATGYPADPKLAQQFVLKDQIHFLKKIAQRTGKDIEIIKQEALADTVITAEQALKEGYIDAIYSGPV